MDNEMESFNLLQLYKTLHTPNGVNRRTLTTTSTEFAEILLALGLQFHLVPSQPT